MIEHERSFVMTHESAHAFVNSFGPVSARIRTEDYYLNNDMRIRIQQCDPVQCFVTKKTGKKSTGYRVEDEIAIDHDVARLLSAGAGLKIVKDRYVLPTTPEYQVTMDFIFAPMKLAVLEIEANSEIVYPIPADITRKLFDVPLTECPLSTCELFKRRIGICGPPSSGKSETAKYFSHRLNTEFGANSFHVVEFATSFIQKYKKAPTFADQFFIWHGQHAREAAAKTCNIVISDCPTFLSYVYALIAPKPEFCPDSWIYLSKLYKRALCDLADYTDIIFLNLLNFKQNNIRYQSAEQASEISVRIKNFLTDHKVPYTDTNYEWKDRVLEDLFWINRYPV